MATPWVDAATAWTDGVPGFGEAAVAADVAACRTGVAARGATVAGRAGCAAAQARSRVAPVGGESFAAARPDAAGMALAAPQTLAATGLRTVARLSSPFATGVTAASPIAPCVVLTSLVAIEQT